MSYGIEYIRFRILSLYILSFDNAELLGLTGLSKLRDCLSVLPFSRLVACLGGRAEREPVLLVAAVVTRFSDGRVLSVLERG